MKLLFDTCDDISQSENCQVTVVAGAMHCDTHDAAIVWGRCVGCLNMARALIDVNFGSSNPESETAAMAVANGAVAKAVRRTH